MESQPWKLENPRKSLRPIGIFDSGVGGLTVLSSISKELPREDLIYFGDTARFPYGPKSKSTVLNYAREICLFLLKYQVKLIVVACNTATALALRTLQSELSIPVIGVIEPAINALAKINPNPKKRIGIIGTRSTIKSNAYKMAIEKNYPLYKSFQTACPLFVTLVEEGWSEKSVSRIIAHEYLDELVREKIDTLILGCTHYPLLKNMLSQEFPSWRLIDGALETAYYVKEYLQKNKLTSKNDKGSIHIYISDMTDYFVTLEKLFFGREIASIRNINLEEELKK